jgi:hypothetical protein
MPLVMSPSLPASAEFSTSAVKRPPLVVETYSRVALS